MPPRKTPADQPIDFFDTWLGFRAETASVQLLFTGVSFHFQMCAHGESYYNTETPLWEADSRTGPGKIEGKHCMPNFHKESCRQANQFMGKPPRIRSLRA